LTIYQKALIKKSICPYAGNIKETPDICGIKYMTNYKKYCCSPTKIGRKHHRDILLSQEKEEQQFWSLHIQEL